MMSTSSTLPDGFTTRGLVVWATSAEAWAVPRHDAVLPVGEPAPGAGCGRAASLAVRPLLRKRAGRIPGRGSSAPHGTRMKGQQVAESVEVQETGWIGIRRWR